MVTKGKWEIVKNAVGTYTIQTEDTRIGEIDRHFNAHLIVAACNACTEIKEANPQAAAESITDMYEALKLYQKHQEGTRGHYCWRCAEAINKAIAKANGK